MKEKNNKGVIVLIVILILLVLGLSGYIVYDKVLSNNKSSSNNDVTTTTTTTTVTEDIITDSKYFKVDEFDYELNGEIIKIGFNYYLLNNNYGWTDEKVKSMLDDNISGYYYNSVEVDISINGNVVKDLNKTVEYDKINDLEKLKETITYLSLENNVQTIKGIDKDYLLFTIYDAHFEVDGNLSPFITNENGKNIFSLDNPDNTGWGINDEDSMFYRSNTSYLVKDGVFYYTLPDCDVPYFESDSPLETNIIKEYSVSVNNDRVEIKEQGSYKGHIAGGTYCGDRG